MLSIYSHTNPARFEAWTTLVKAAPKKEGRARYHFLNIALMYSSVLYNSSDKKQSLEIFTKLSKHKLFKNGPELQKLCSVLEVLGNISEDTSRVIDFFNQLSFDKEKLRESLKLFLVLVKLGSLEKALKGTSSTEFKEIPPKIKNSFDISLNDNQKAQFLNTFDQFRQPFALFDYVDQLKEKAQGYKSELTRQAVELCSHTSYLY